MGRHIVARVIIVTLCCVVSMQFRGEQQVGSTLVATGVEVVDFRICT